MPMKLTLLTSLALSLCGSAFALSGSGMEDDPFFLYGEDVYNKDVVLPYGGYYRCSSNYMNSLTSASGEDCIFVVGSVNTGKFVNLGYSAFHSTTLYLDKAEEAYVDFGNLTEFIGGSNVVAKTDYRTDGVIYGTAQFYESSDFYVTYCNVENFGNIRFLTGGDQVSFSNNFVVSGSFVNNGLVEIRRGRIDITGSFTNNKYLLLSTLDSELFVRGHGSFLSSASKGLYLYNLTVESSGTFIQTSAETLLINNYANLTGSLETGGDLLLNGGEFTLRGSLRTGGDIVLSNAIVDFVGDDIKTSDGALVGLVLAEGTKSIISYLNNKLEFASLELNGADLTLDALNPFVVSGEAWGGGDYHLIINNFTEGRVFIGSLDDEFDLSRVIALDKNGNDLGDVYYVNGYLTLVPEASTCALVSGLLSLSLAVGRGRKSRSAA